jgi:hypothetical protein
MLFPLSFFSHFSFLYLNNYQDQYEDQYSILYLSLYLNLYTWRMCWKSMICLKKYIMLFSSITPQQRNPTRCLVLLQQKTNKQMILKIVTLKQREPILIFTVTKQIKWLTTKFMQSFYSIHVLVPWMLFSSCLVATFPTNTWMLPNFLLHLECGCK